MLKGYLQQFSYKLPWLGSGTGIILASTTHNPPGSSATGLLATVTMDLPRVTLLHQLLVQVHRVPGQMYVHMAIGHPATGRDSIVCRLYTFNDTSGGGGVRQGVTVGSFQVEGFYSTASQKW